MTQQRFVNQQPQVINNVFGIVPEEKVLQVYECETGGCGCGPKFTVTLTDARLIQRRQECSCCGTGPRFDTMLFLSDISSITDSVMGKCCGSCNCNCCCCCSSCCAGTTGKEISFTGPFGTLVFTFDKNDVLNALVHIPAAALPHKTSNAKDTSNQF